MLNILGSLGQIYMLILLALLFLGSGLGVWAMINSSMNNKKDKISPPQKKSVVGQGSSMDSQGKEKTKIGGIKMQNNGWFKLAIFSFVGILVSIAVLGLVSTNNNMADSNVHLQHQQQGLQQNQNAMAGMNGNMQMQGGMNVGTPMGNMQMQGNMNGNMQMQGGMNSMNVPADYNYMMLQQQLNQMQQQLYMMQQQMQMQNGSMQPSSSGGSMPMGGSSGGGMGMM